MRRLSPVALFSLTFALTAACSSMPLSGPEQQRQKPMTEKVTEVEAPSEWLGRAFEQYPLIGLSEQHFHPGVMDAFIALISTPGFVASFDDIVVEFGNARWQETVDRYIAGEDVSLQEVSSAWRDTLFFTAWTTTAYPRFFQAIRELNQTLPKPQRLRVVLAEEPFNWQTEDKASWMAKSAGRDGFYLQRIQQQVLDKNRKALLIFGSFHLTRQPLPGLEMKQPPLGQLLTESLPGKSLVFWTDVQSGDKAPWRTSFSNGATPALVTKDQLDSLSFNDVALRPAEQDQPLNKVTDGVLLLAPEARYMTMSPLMLNDAQWLDEIERRGRIIGGSLQKRLEMLLHDQKNQQKNKQEK